MYKARVSDFDPVKASQLGDYLPAKLGFDEGERALAVLKLEKSYAESGKALIFFANGKGVCIPISAYETKGNRRKLTGAYSVVSEPVGVCFVKEEKRDILLVADNGKALVIDSSLVPEKATRTSQGVTLFSLKAGARLLFVSDDIETYAKNGKRYRKNKLPSSGTALDPDDRRLLPDSVASLLV